MKSIPSSTAAAREQVTTCDTATGGEASLVGCSASRVTKTKLATSSPVRSSSKMNPLPQNQARGNFARSNFDIIFNIANRLSYESLTNLMTVLPMDPNDLTNVVYPRERLCLSANAFAFSPTTINRNKSVALLRLFCEEAKLELIKYGASTTVKVDNRTWSIDNKWHDQERARWIVPFHGAGLRTLEFLGNSVALFSLPMLAPQWHNLTRVTIIYESPIFASTLIDGLTPLSNLVHLHISAIRFAWIGNPNSLLTETWLNRLESLYLASTVPVDVSIVDFASNPALQSLQHLGLVNIQDGLAYLARRESSQLRTRLETVLVRGAEEIVRRIERHTFTRSPMVFNSSVI